jgi:alanyl-tRNA synthetase
VDQVPERVDALTSRTRQPRQARQAPPAGPVRIDPAGHRYLVTEDPGIDVSDLPGEARRLAGELSAVVVLLRPDAGDGSLRIGVAVPGPLTAQVPATAVLDRVLAVTGGRGGGSPAFAQGGGAEPGDLPGAVARISAVLGLDAPAQHDG